MSDRRIEPEDLGDLAALPPEDPRVRALDSRARAQLRAYQEFVAPGQVPEGARVADAERKLGEALEREIGAPVGSPTPAHSAPAAPRRGGGWLGELLAPRLRPALAMAAVLIVAGGVWLITSAPRREGAPLMRGPGPTVPESGLVAAAPKPLPDGSLRLSWTPAAEAASYTVVFLSPDLAEITRVTDLGTTHVDLRPGSLPNGLKPGTWVLWRVLAMRGEDEVARSSTMSVSLPRAATGSP